MFTTTSTDATEVRAHDEGSGPPVVLLHPGLDDGSRLRRVAELLAPRYRVLRPHRRQYRLDLKADPRLGSPCTVAQEVDDVLAIVRAVGGPVLLYGHSDGGVVALEALARSPSSFAGAVVYEPAAAVDGPLSGPGGRVLREARAALAANRPGRAMAVFVAGAAGQPPWAARVVGVLTGLIPRYRRLVPAQIDSLEALDALGPRLDVWAGITVPTVLLGGDRSPASVTRMLEAVAAAMPDAERVTMAGRNHGADLRAPREVARVIQAMADRVLDAGG
jgi:pimeloyl-ACP methyl ester carboxylesterase